MVINLRKDEIQIKKRLFKYDSQFLLFVFFTTESFTRMGLSKNSLIIFVVIAPFKGLGVITPWFK
jgi:hypothetical protein